VFVVSEGLSDADAAVLGLRRAPSVAAALDVAGIDPAADRVLRVSDAGNTCLLPEPPAAEDAENTNVTHETNLTNEN
jgi:hypothetical protein